MTYNYSAKAGEHAAKSAGISLPISTKKSIEICNAIRGKTVSKAKTTLQNSAKMKIPIPMKIFNDNAGHKAGMAAGRFAVNACQEILKILASAEANAQAKGLNTSNLVVKHIAAQQGPKVWRYGRQKRRETKRTHIEIILEENKIVDKKQTKPTSTK